MEYSATETFYCQYALAVDN